MTKDIASQVSQVLLTLVRVAGENGLGPPLPSRRLSTGLSLRLISSSATCFPTAVNDVSEPYWREMPGRRAGEDSLVGGAGSIPGVGGVAKASDVMSTSSPSIQNSPEPRIPVNPIPNRLPPLENSTAPISVPHPVRRFRILPSGRRASELATQYPDEPRPTCGDIPQSSRRSTRAAVREVFVRKRLSVDGQISWMNYGGVG
jgi:hypothetical protein